MNSRQNARSRSAFTLIEMLVVIAIIALLVSMLAPSIGRTLENARTVQCLSNMRQIAAGILQYAADHEGRLMYLETPGLQDGAGVPRESWAGLLVREGYLDAPLSSSQNDIKTHHVFWCPRGLADGLFDWSFPESPWSENPSLQRPWPAHIDTPEGLRFVHSWYSLNARTEINYMPFVRRWHLNDHLTPTWIAHVRLADRTVIIHDGNWTANNQPGRIPARHGNPRSITNFAFFDGRAESIRTRVFAISATAEDTYPRFRN